jgi:serine/threonine protein kinase
LEALQLQGIVHKDLGGGNYLVNITKKNGKRSIEAVISDLGSAVYVQNVKGVKAQGHSAYTAPEGLFAKRLKGKDYFSTDLYAVGCIFYRLYYWQKPQWLTSKLIKNNAPEQQRYKKLVRLIDKQIGLRSKTLTRKQRRNTRLNLQEQFETLILQMIQPSPAKRGSVTEIKNKLEAIYNQL